jgi:hypothetical protein
VNAPRARVVPRRMRQDIEDEFRRSTVAEMNMRRQRDEIIVTNALRQRMYPSRITTALNGFCDRVYA